MVLDIVGVERSVEGDRPDDFLGEEVERKLREEDRQDSPA